MELVELKIIEGIVANNKFRLKSLLKIGIIAKPRPNGSKATSKYWRIALWYGLLKSSVESKAIAVIIENILPIRRYSGKFTTFSE